MKNSFVKRILSVFLAVLMAFSVMPLTPITAEADFIHDIHDFFHDSNSVKSPDGKYFWASNEGLSKNDGTVTINNYVVK